MAGNDRFARRLDRLLDAVVAMGDLVSTQLGRAVTAIRCCDRRLAREVIEADREVNRRSLALESECLTVIARHQPVASDLRAVVAAFTVVTDVERVGDLATNLAEYALESADCRLPDADLERIAALARTQYDAAIRAFATGDADRCLEIAARDGELDERCDRVNERIVRELLALSIEGGIVTGPVARDAEFGDEVDPVTAGAADAAPTAGPDVRRVFEDVSRSLLIVRDFERIGDHAVNVAARTVYAVEGDDAPLE